MTFLVIDRKLQQNKYTAKMASAARRQIIGGAAIRRSTKVGGGGDNKLFAVAARRAGARPYTVGPMLFSLGKRGNAFPTTFLPTLCCFVIGPTVILVYFIWICNRNSDIAFPNKKS